MANYINFKFCFYVDKSEHFCLSVSTKLVQNNFIRIGRLIDIHIRYIFFVIKINRENFSI